MQSVKYDLSIHMAFISALPTFETDLHHYTGCPKGVLHICSVARLSCNCYCISFASSRLFLDFVFYILAIYGRCEFYFMASRSSVSV